MSWTRHGCPPPPAALGLAGQGAAGFLSYWQLASGALSPSAPTPRHASSDLSVSHTTKPQVAFLLPHPVQHQPSLSRRQSRSRVAQVLSFNEQGVGRGGCSGPTCHKESQFQVSFVLPLSTKQGSSPPGL